VFGQKIKRIHFVGIGGVGMSGIAELLKNMGFEISGSDIRESYYTQRLEKIGCRIKFFHSEENVKDADVVVYSSAINMENPEIKAAKKMGIPVIKRAEMLAELMRMKFSILISGSHGKTTTTSMCAILLHLAGLDPTVVIGGRLDILGGNAKLGEGNYLVAEADESDGSFLKLFPTIAIITNVDREHISFYGSFENLLNSFVEFANRVPFYGSVILCDESEELRRIKNRIERRKITYGFSDESDFYAYDLKSSGYGYTFKVGSRYGFIGEYSTKVPGRHNVLNSLAVVSLAYEMGIDVEVVKKSMEIFSGVDRRFQVKGTKNGVVVIDDYAHHPTEIRTTFEAISGMSPSRVIAIFQPHRYSRVKELFEEFVESFDYPDILFCTEIYSAGESVIEGISGRVLFEAIEKRRDKKETFFEVDFSKLVNRVIEILKPGDLLVTLGAGNIYQVGDGVLKKLEKKKEFK